MEDLIGKQVKIINQEQSYTTYKDWFRTNRKDITKYAYGALPPLDAIATILYQGVHTVYKTDLVVLLDINGEHYLVSDEAFQLV